MNPISCPTSAQMQANRDHYKMQWIISLAQSIRVVKAHISNDNRKRLAKFFIDITGYYMINDPPRLDAWARFLMSIRDGFIFIHPEFEVPAMTIEGWQSFYLVYGKDQR